MSTSHVMRELCEFRVAEEHAHLLFDSTEGTKLGEGIYQTVRKVLIATDDPRFKEMKRLQDAFKIRKETFYTGWNIEYRYTKEELATAQLFNIEIRAVFEPPGELCGTVFDESDTCLECGAGRRQASDLALDLRKAPKTKEIACTIARDEWLVSQRLAEIMVDAQLTGFDLLPVRHKSRYQEDAVDLAAVPSGRKLLEEAEVLGLSRPEWEFYVWLNRPEQKTLADRAWAEYAELREQKARRNWKSPPVWYQLVPTSRPLPMVPPTRAGKSPFDDDPNDEYRCPNGHVIGLNLLSEVSVARDSWDGSDVIRTSNMTGHRMGLLVPSPCLLISPRFYKLLQKEKIKGYKAEVAYLV